MAHCVRCLTTAPKADPHGDPTRPVILLYPASRFTFPEIPKNRSGGGYLCTTCIKFLTAKNTPLRITPHPPQGDPNVRDQEDDRQ